MTEAFTTPIDRKGNRLEGPWRMPRNLLQAQTYGGHASVHDDATARSMGFAAAPIEGPTHISQFVPLCCELWGARWLEQGCIALNYKAAVMDGEEVMAFVEIPENGSRQSAIGMVKRDGTEVLRGTASIGADTQGSAVETKLAMLGEPDPGRVIFGHVAPGMVRPRFTARIAFDQGMGDLYPFTLSDKIASITEPSPWYEERADSPWGAPVLPVEMISVLAHHRAAQDPWLPRKSTIDLFVDQQIKLIDGPLLAETDYEIERSLVGLSASRRTESCWVRTDIYRPGGSDLLASMLLNVASFKDSYAGYEQDQAAALAGAAAR